MGQQQLEYNYHMISKQIDFEALKEENFQLKNEITDLKNGFDLNRDVLKILQEQSKETQPKLRIFYQIISRLTGVNNQTMMNNMDLLQERNKIKSEVPDVHIQKLKLESEIQKLNQKIDELTENINELYKPKELYFQYKEEMKNLHSQIMACNEECLRKKFQISHLHKIIKVRQILKQEKEVQEMKKPIIPSVSSSGEQKITLTQSDLDEIPKTYQTHEQKKFQCLYRETKRQNRRLKILIQQLEYRLTLLTRIYNIEPAQQSRFIQPENGQNISENQLSLLLFALKNTELQEQPDNQTIKLSINRKWKQIDSRKSNVSRCKSLQKI